MNTLVWSVILAVALTGVVACRDGNNDSNSTVATPTLSFTPIKTFHFTWTDVAHATYYKLLENPDGVSGFTQVGSDIPAGIESMDLVVPLYARINAQYILQSCNTDSCGDSSVLSVSGTLTAAVGYIKASNPESCRLTGWLGTEYWTCEFFGSSVTLSADGNTLAVGAPGEESAATGIGGDQNDNSASTAGAVYVFSRSGETWAQQAYVKASNTDDCSDHDITDLHFCGDHFGNSVTLSADGNTLAVGAPMEESAATGIGGDESDDSAESAGAVYVFSRTGGETWAQQAYVKASNTEAEDVFGSSVALSADGNTLAVGAVREDSAATGIGGDESDNSALGAGAVYLY
jgi:hypothetical protein